MSEVLGLAPAGSATRPAVDVKREEVARRAGGLVMDILKNGGPLPRDLITRKSLENACAIVAATGGSTNAALHIPAIAHEAGIRFDIDDVDAVSRRTPLIADLRPGGRFTAKDVHDVGGAAVILRGARRRLSRRQLLDGHRSHNRRDLWVGGKAGRGGRSPYRSAFGAGRRARRAQR